MICKHLDGWVAGHVACTEERRSTGFWCKTVDEAATFHDLYSGGRIILKMIWKGIFQHTVCACAVIISVYGINWLVFIMKQTVFCEVRTQSVHVNVLAALHRQRSNGWLAYCRRRLTDDGRAGRLHRLSLHPWFRPASGAAGNFRQLETRTEAERERRRSDCLSCCSDCGSHDSVSLRTPVHSKCFSSRYSTTASFPVPVYGPSTMLRSVLSVDADCH
jgi:hypothetical protein